MALSRLRRNQGAQKRVRWSRLLLKRLHPIAGLILELVYDDTLLLSACTYILTSV